MQWLHSTLAFLCLAHPSPPITIQKRLSLLPAFWANCQPGPESLLRENELKDRGGEKTKRNLFRKIYNQIRRYYIERTKCIDYCLQRGREIYYFRHFSWAWHADSATSWSPHCIAAYKLVGETENYYVTHYCSHFFDGLVRTSAYATVAMGNQIKICLKSSDCPISPEIWNDSCSENGCSILWNSYYYFLVQELSNYSFLDK